MAKIMNTGNWGREEAKERYNLKQSRLPDDNAATNVETPQNPEDQRDVGYSNRTKGWVRGAPEGKEPTMHNETAEDYPDGNFDKQSRTGKR
jgi:hypothetical protein